MLRTEGIPSLGHIGFGCLQLGNLSDDNAVEVVVEAYRQGVRVFDTAAAYCENRHNEKVLGKAIQKIQELFGKDSFLFFSTKCGINFGTLNTPREGYEDNLDELSASLELSLKTLQVTQIPLFYLHRINPKLETSRLIQIFELFKKFVEDKKVAYVGISEPTETQILLADSIFANSSLPYNPFAFVQSACSVATRRAFENGVFQTCREKGIQFISYTSTVRGLVDERLSEALKVEELADISSDEIISTIQKTLNIPANDFRFFVDFFDKAVIKTNIACILQFQTLAKEWGIPASQLALCWQKAKGMIPIPGTTSIEHLTSNVNAMATDLTETQLSKIDFCFAQFEGDPNPSKILSNEELNIKKVKK